MTLQLLDDLAQPLGFGGVGGALGQDQRLKRVDILRQSIGQGPSWPGLQHIKSA